MLKNQHIASPARWARRQSHVAKLRTDVVLGGRAFIGAANDPGNRSEMTLSPSKILRAGDDAAGVAGVQTQSRACVALGVGGASDWELTTRGAI